MSQYYDYDQERLLTRKKGRYITEKEKVSVSSVVSVALCSYSVDYSRELDSKWIILYFLLFLGKMTSEISSDDRQDEFIEDYLTERDIYKRVLVR